MEGLYSINSFTFYALRWLIILLINLPRYLQKLNFSIHRFSPIRYNITIIKGRFLP
nr:MAG TPA: hypothetical protein [Bacteriophage sp.]